MDRHHPEGAAVETAVQHCGPKGDREKVEEAVADIDVHFEQLEKLLKAGRES